MRNGIGLIVIGFMTGVAFIIACGDDSGPADARAQDASNVCNCPPPPQSIDSRLRRYQMSKTATIATFQEDSIEMNCLQLTQIPDSKALWGGCRAVTGGVVVQTSAPAGDTGWSCEWNNPTESPRTAQLTAYITCLLPEGATTPDGG